jgi:hypothetical protein
MASGLLATSRATARGIRRSASTNPLLTNQLLCQASLRMCSSTEGKDRLHSSDIAFKPTQDGWGYSQTYSSRWEQIFKKDQAATSASNDPASTTLPPSDTVYTARLALLTQARDAGALSPALFEQVRAYNAARRAPFTKMRALV